MTKSEFLEYSALDDIQAKLILEKFQFIFDVYQKGLFPFQEPPIMTEPLLVTEIEQWEREHLVQLPQDFKWFLSTIGCNFCPQSYHLLDIRNNQKYIHHFEDCETGNVNNDNNLDDNNLDYTLFNVTFDGCTFYHILGTHKCDYGKVYSVCYDVVYDNLEFVQTKDEYECVMKNLFEYGFSLEPDNQNFLTFFKSRLFDMYKELKRKIDCHDTSPMQVFF